MSLAPEVLAAITLLIAVIGTLASAGGSIVGFIRGCRKLLIGIIMEPLSKLREDYNEYKVESSRQIDDLQSEQVLLKSDFRILREDIQEQRQETSDIRRQLQRHSDREDIHAK